LGVHGKSDTPHHAGTGRPFEEDLTVTSSEIGILCSHWIDFRRLPLPVDRDGFRRWVAGHLHALRFLLQLNACAAALPEPLLVEEMTGFLYDPAWRNDSVGFFPCLRKSFQDVSLA
jgi:hypothetical protein